MIYFLYYLHLLVLKSKSYRVESGYRLAQNLGFCRRFLTFPWLRLKVFFVTNGKDNKTHFLTFSLRIWKLECIYFKHFWGNMHKWNPLSNATQIPSSKLHCQNSNFVQNPRKAFTNVFTFLSSNATRIKLIFRSINFHILTPNIYQALGAFYVYYYVVPFIDWPEILGHNRPLLQGIGRNTLH